MFFKERICWIFTLIILLSYNSVVSARTSHDVSIRVAEIGRYHLEHKSVIANGNDLIQTVDVVILSNSDRKWRFVAIPFGNCIGIEWSRDNRVWHSFDSSGTGETMIMTGGRSDWRSYRFYIRVNGNSSKAMSLGYQLLFSE